MKNYKSILIAGAIAVGLYLFLHSKKILPMTLAQKAAWHEKVSRRMAQMDMAEKTRALKAARKEKAAAEGTPETETRLTPMEMMLALRAAAEEKLKETQEEQGTGFDYIRERNPLTPAVPVEKTQDKKKTAVKKATAKKIAQKIAQKVVEKVKKKKAEEVEAKKKAEEVEAKKKADEKKGDLLDFFKNWSFFPFN